MVLARSHLDSDSEDEPIEIDDDDVDVAVRVLPQHRWLLEQLPKLPQFNATKKQACSILRQVSISVMCFLFGK